VLPGMLLFFLVREFRPPRPVHRFGAVQQMVSPWADNPIVAIGKSNKNKHTSTTANNQIQLQSNSSLAHLDFDNLQVGFSFFLHPHLMLTYRTSIFFVDPRRSFCVLFLFCFCFRSFFFQVPLMLTAGTLKGTNKFTQMVTSINRFKSTI